jgi:type I restriction enzyme, S subunit
MPTTTAKPKIHQRATHNSLSPPKVRFRTTVVVRGEGQAQSCLMVCYATGAMTVKPGYKMTDIGVIPEDWGLEHIENISRIATGSKNTQDRIESGTYPFYVRSQTVERIDTFSFDGEAVLTAGDGVGTGKVFHYVNGKFDVHQRVYRIFDFATVMNGFYFYLYFSCNFYNRIMQMTAKSSVDSVRRPMISRMLVPIPPKTEQTAIAQTLSDVDALIEALTNTLAKKRDIKQASMQQLLTGKTRLPGFSGEWEAKLLGEVLTVCHGKNQKEVASENGQYPILASGGQIGTATAYLHTGPSVMIGRKGTIDKPRYVEGPFWCVDTLFYSTVDRRHDAKFVYFCFCQIDWRAYNEASGVPSLNARTIEKIEVLVPPLPEQRAIAQILTDLDSEISAVEARIEKTRALKLGMMQELLTGRIRLI